MKIAILVWGSLYWRKGELLTTGDWLYDGPILPIEFSRISRDNKLTLVIKPGFDNVTTLYGISAYATLWEARENLRTRENTENINNIGYIDFTSNTNQIRPNNSFVADILQQWNKTKKFDAIIWSDFAPYFTDAIHFPFNLDNIIRFLSNLPDTEKKPALEYIEKAPPQVQTRFRKDIESHFKDLR